MDGLLYEQKEVTIMSAMQKQFKRNAALSYGSGVLQYPYLFINENIQK